MATNLNPKKMLKKITAMINAVIFLIFFSSLLISSASAKNNGFNIKEFDATSGLRDTGFETGHLYTAGGNDLELTIGNTIKIILSLVGIIFLILMFYSGFLWMTASGDTKAIEKAKENIKNSLIGLIIVLGAYAITNLISTILVTNIK